VSGYFVLSCEPCVGDSDVPQQPVVQSFGGVAGGLFVVEFEDVESLTQLGRTHIDVGDQRAVGRIGVRQE
jgi:hypothetical protein